MKKSEEHLNLERRIGKLLVTSDFMSDCLDSLQEAFGQLKFIPLKVEYIYYHNRFEMFGISHMFDKTPEGEITPKYNVIFQRDEDDTITISVEKEK